MTRLKSEWIKDIEHEVEEWNRTLLSSTGAGLLELAAKGSGIGVDMLTEAIAHCRVGVVSITGGQGIIGTFAESVAAIVTAMGFGADVAKRTDVDGFYEVQSRGANVVFMADDDRFLAVNLDTNTLGENDRSTACGYTEALEGMMGKRNRGSLKGQKVLLLGYGRVGREIETYLYQKGASVVIYDRNEEVCRGLSEKGKDYLRSPEEIKGYEFIMDATSTGPWISKDMLREDVLIAAPGIPFSLDEEAREHFKGQWIHDNLPIGTATMLAFALGERHGK